VLRTKLRPPVARPTVPRSPLIARLREGAGARLTLVDAPPGWGKTTLLVSWKEAPEEGRPFTWVTLDSYDNDPVRFWTYMVEALRTAAPGLGVEALSWLRVPGADIADDVLAPLLNDLAALETPLVLVLDDYHHITNAEIHGGLAYLLAHLPSTIQLVIATRSDPPLPLGRLRVSGELVEIRATDLGFTEAEADRLLNGLLGLGLAGADVARLQRRTEGWAAGLCLAAMSLLRRSDPAVFIAEFAGDDRHVVDYLSAEVLAGIPEDVQQFLLQTSVLDRLSAPLCDAVTGRRDSAAVLERLERSNLFLVPLDDTREWYRYHQLFAGLLRHQLTRADHGAPARLHRLASDWYDAAGWAPEAIGHALASGDVERATELVRQHWSDTFNLGRLATVSAWLDALPASVVEHDVRLCSARAWIAMDRGELVGAGTWIARAEAALTALPRQARVPWLAPVAVLRTVHRFKIGDLRRAVTDARRIVELPTPAIFPRTVAHCILGVTLYWAGQRETAATALEQALELARRDDNHLACMYVLGYLALVKADTDPAAADRLAAEAVAVARDPSRAQHFVGLVAHLALGRLAVRRGNLEQAERELERAAELAGHGAGALELAASLLDLADLQRRLGREAAARDLVSRARDTLGQCRDPGALATLADAAARSLGATADRSATGRNRRNGTADALTDRELAVLRLLASGLSQREVASALYVSYNTVKTHAASAYRKLGVGGRAEAVAAASARGLL
jgi:LuxR family maltose regulon positive regulatory protein